MSISAEKPFIVLLRSDHPLLKEMMSLYDENKPRAQWGISLSERQIDDALTEKGTPDWVKGLFVGAKSLLGEEA